MRDGINAPRQGLGDVTAVIPCRGGATGLVRAVRSILAGTLAPHKVIVADQGPVDEHSRPLREIESDRVRHVRTETRGISAALNCGIEASQTDLIAITGDDCEVGADWLKELREQLTSGSATGVVFGSIWAAPHDSAKGFIPSYFRTAPAIATRMSEKYRIAGTSACMGIRRAAWLRLGGFDQSLGVGARFPSAEDTDFAIRALAAGYTLREIPSASVVHHGFYSWAQRSSLLERNWYGTGAAVAKNLRLRHKGFGLSLLAMAQGWATGGSRIATGLGGGSHRRATLGAFLRGLRDGFRAPLDPSSGHFAPAGTCDART